MIRENYAGFHSGIMRICSQPEMIICPLENGLSGILTLPGTAGRGFYVFPKEIRWHTPGACITGFGKRYSRYTNICKQN